MTVAMKRGLYRIRAVLIGAGLALSACASVPSSPPGIERIAYRPSPPPFCGGRCETKNFTVGIDGVVRGETVAPAGARASDQWLGGRRDTTKQLGSSHAEGDRDTGGAGGTW